MERPNERGSAVTDSTSTRPPADRLAAARDREQVLRRRLLALVDARAAQDAAASRLSQRRSLPGVSTLLAADVARHRAQARLLAAEIARTRVYLRRQAHLVDTLTGD